MPGMDRARRAQGDKPRGHMGRWRCIQCGGPNAPWRQSAAPAQAAAYHRAKYHPTTPGGQR